MQEGVPSVAVILCAGGSSHRMGGVKKEYLSMPEQGHSVLSSSLAAFAVCPYISTIAIAILPGTEAEARASAGDQDGSSKAELLFVEGGLTRRASVHNALNALKAFNPSHVLIHDGARPWVTPELIKRVMDAVLKFDAAIPVLPLIETPKELANVQDDPAEGEMRFIKRHLKRNDVGTAQTPQGFRFLEILAAHEKAAQREVKEGIEYTDDAEVWGEFVGRVAVVEGDPRNRKITYPEDLLAGSAS